MKNIKTIPLLGLAIMVTLFVLDFKTTDAVTSNLFTSSAILMGLITFKSISKK